MAGEMVVLVEDDETVAEGIAAILIIEGYRVHKLAAGRPLLPLLGSMQPAAVILDISLPDIDGVDLAHMVRRSHPALPIIFTTGHLVTERVAGLKADKHAYLLQKPFELSELIALLERITGAP